jgi:SAM-dependent methyltransferase
MPSQQLLNYLYSRSSLSVIGEWGPTTLTLPEHVCAQRELARVPMRYFELGVGRGHLYQRFLASGWQCTGVDPGAWASACPNVFKDLSEVPSGMEADLLVAFDVLEHLSDPIAALRTLRKIAAPNARLYCAMPNRESLRAIYHRETWRMLRPLGHVNYFSRKSVKRAMQSAGFAVELLKATDLWQVRIPRSFGHLIQNLVELLSLGDQWLVVARTY